MLIPASAIHRGQVKIIRDNKKFTLNVKIGAVNGEMAEILDGQVLVEDEILLGKEK